MKKSLTLEAQGTLIVEINAVKLAISQIMQNADAVRDARNKLEDSLRQLSNTFQSDDLNGLMSRLDRLRELHNMSEFGGFQIQVDQALEKFWQKYNLEG